MRGTYAWFIVWIMVLGALVYAWLRLPEPVDALIMGLMTLIAALAGRYTALAPPAPPKPAAPPKPSAEPLRLLALLQREGRLVDFFMEDITGYADPQVGAAVRDIHRQCGDVLKEHLVIEPVLPQKLEEEQVTVPAGFDPSAIRLTGNVTGQPPFTGTLKHHGWRVKQLKLTPPPEGQDEFVLMPAEVELA